MRILLLALMLVGCNDRDHSKDGNNQVPPAFRKESDPFQGCIFVSAEPTGTKRYCGKACWHTLKRKTYDCPDGRREIIE